MLRVSRIYGNLYFKFQVYIISMVYNRKRHDNNMHIQHFKYFSNAAFFLHFASH